MAIAYIQGQVYRYNGGEDTGALIRSVKNDGIKLIIDGTNYWATVSGGDGSWYYNVPNGTETVQVMGNYQTLHTKNTPTPSTNWTSIGSNTWQWSATNLGDTSNINFYELSES